MKRQRLAMGRQGAAIKAAIKAVSWQTLGVFGLGVIACTSAQADIGDWQGKSLRVLETSAGPMTVEALAAGFEEPWALGFLPSGAVLVTLRDGALVHISPDGARHEVQGVPAVHADGQGGLLDLLVPRDFAKSREIYLSYVAPLGTGGATSLGRGKLSADGRRLEGFTQLWHGNDSDNGRHFGSRILEAADGAIFLTTGDLGTGPSGMQAQDRARSEGKIYKFNRDGTPAVERPNWAAGIYSMGHRNAQGAAFDRDGRLLVVEHGARGGDELNHVQEGRNYGWPVITYGRNYTGLPIGIGTHSAGMEQPLHYWVPSIAPSGLVVHSGEKVTAWRGDVFTGSLNSDFIARLDLDQAGEGGFAQERIESPETARPRDIREGPDGHLWFLSVGNGALYRLVPTANNSGGQ